MLDKMALRSALWVGLRIMDVILCLETMRPARRRTTYCVVKGARNSRLRVSQFIRIHPTMATNDTHSLQGHGGKSIGR